MIGQVVNQFKILEKLGEGGMGEVYLAEDTDLDRKAALKFLPPYYSKDPDINARFKREAKAAAALSHPNIITIFEIGEHEGRAYMAMEYVEGLPLSERIEQAELTTEETVEIAVQICSGLGRAHEAGIVHRDIKPENIILDKAGHVKILDFGLAQKRGAIKITKEATTLGTIHYMSPEQCQSGDLDARTDIWSVGVVLYQMITGRLPFQGDYENAITYSILNEEPEPIARYKSNVSDNLQRAVEKALRKDPETRYQTVDDLLADLRQEKQISSSAIRPTVPAKKRPPVAPVGLIAILFVVLIAVALALLSRQDEQPSISPATHRQITFTGNATKPIVSPDGQFVGFVTEDDSATRFMIQDFSGGRPLELFSGSSRIYEARWSPDGSNVALFTVPRAGGSPTSYLVPRLGGEPRRINSLPNHFTFSPDGTQLAGSMDFGPQRLIMLLDREGGEPAQISLEFEFRAFRGIDWSPLGDRLLFLTEDKDQFRIWTIKIDGADPQTVVEDSTRLRSPRWSANGKAIYYLRTRGPTKDLMKIAVSTSSGGADGSAVILQSGLRMSTSFSLSKDNKRISYASEQMHSNLWLITLDQDGQHSGAEQLTKGTSRIVSPNLSPDGQQVAFSMTQGESSNLFVVPIQGGTMKQLTFSQSLNDGPVWSPDGKELAYGSNSGGDSKVWKISAQGGTPEPIAMARLRSYRSMLAWSPGANILYRSQEAGKYTVFNLSNKEYRILASDDSTSWTNSPQYSKDGRFVAVSRFLPERGLWIISTEDSSQTKLANGPLFPVSWSEDGQRIFAINRETDEVVAISLDAGNSETLLKLPFEVGPLTITMSADGKTIVCAVEESQSDVWLMENFDPDVE